jgi:hypothetical protein
MAMTEQERAAVCVALLKGVSDEQLTAALIATQDMSEADKAVQFLKSAAMHQAKYLDMIRKGIVDADSVISKAHAAYRNSMIFH